jgi:4,5:9,10-diseco-3-hydroxy-5,9,17-trioxoandrosta-1(10),2-diene-4-oate hydrolase
LLCLHAIGHGARDFADLRSRFKDRFRIIALDWPGQGNSATDRHPASVVRYAQLLMGFMDTLKLGRVILLGNSIGGAAALRYTNDHPEKVARLILINSGGLDRVDWVARVVTRRMAAFFRAGARGARWYPAAFGLYYRMVLPGRAAREQRDRIIASAVEVAPILAEAWKGFGEASSDQRASAKSLQCPVFVAWAKGDRANQLRRNLPGIRGIPKVRFETFPGGHAPFLECPEEFARSLASFLGEAVA